MRDAKQLFVALILRFGIDQLKLMCTSRLGIFSFSVNKQSKQRVGELFSEKETSNSVCRIEEVSDTLCQYDVTEFYRLECSKYVPFGIFKTPVMKVRVCMCRSAKERERERKNLHFVVQTVSTSMMQRQNQRDREREKESFAYENIDRFYCLKKCLRVLASRMAEACLHQ
jgi:hypothetical protein